jgi:hypothetical protein
MRALLIIIFNVINILFFYLFSEYILNIELELIYSNKWKVFLIGIALFTGWVFLCSFRIKKLNKYIYIISFILCLGFITYFSRKIIDYQDNVNLERARLLIDKVEKGENISNTYYWLGLSSYRFIFEEKGNGDSKVLIFRTKKGYYYRYDFKLREWSLMTLS